MPEYGGTKALLLCSVIAGVLALPDWTEVELLWKKSWFGYLRIVPGVCICVWFLWHIPPAGYSITAMAVVAGVMAVRSDMSGREKWLWFVLLLAFMVVEIRAINHDREQAQENFMKITTGLETTINEGKSAITGLQTTIQEGREHFDRTMQRSDAILSGVVDSLKAQTGGDSFAFLTFTAEPAQAFEMHWQNFLAPKMKPYFLVSVTSHGKYPLRNTHATLMDDERRLAAMQEYNQHPNGDWMKAINSADSEYEMPYLRPQSPEAPTGEVDVIGIYPMAETDSKHLSIAFGAPNGYWNEVLHLGRVKGIWHQCLSVMGPTVKQATHPFIYCDSDWPEGKQLAEKDWDFTPSKK